MCNQLLRKLRQEIVSLGNIMRPIASVLRAGEPLVWSVSFAAFFSSFFCQSGSFLNLGMCIGHLWRLHCIGMMADGEVGKARGCLAFLPHGQGTGPLWRSSCDSLSFCALHRERGKSKRLDSNPNAIITVSRYAVSFCCSPLVRALPRWSESGLEICITIPW